MSLVTLPVDAPFEEILAVIRRDGGIIIKDFLTPEQVADFNAASAPIFEDLRKNPDISKLPELGVDFYASNTTHIRGMLGKMPKQTSLVVMHPLWHKIMHETFTTQQWIGDNLITTENSYVMSVGSAFHVGPGASDQLLHRDQAAQGIPFMEGSLYTACAGCLVAGTRSTVKNGATRVIPGSHLWGVADKPRPDQTVPAEMEPGSTYHGAGANTCTPGEPDDVRILYGVFATKDFLRTEEAIHLSTPLSVVKSLDREVLRRVGYAKGVGGTGNLSTTHPMDRLDDIRF
ncbi:hypothetical protein MNV49_001818 [Pseudohyphozyma bogoriensis]|nr:hypothetical protein MNV49_001818 [Pseudohyphozyma bogoriensis]